MIHFQSGAHLSNKRSIGVYIPIFSDLSIYMSERHGAPARSPLTQLPGNHSWLHPHPIPLPLAWERGLDCASGSNESPRPLAGEGQGEGKSPIAIVGTTLSRKQGRGNSAMGCA